MRELVDPADLADQRSHVAIHDLEGVQVTFTCCPSNVAFGMFWVFCSPATVLVFAALLFPHRDKFLGVRRGLFDESVEMVPVSVLAAELALRKPFLPFNESSHFHSLNERRHGVGIAGDDCREFPLRDPVVFQEGAHYRKLVGSNLQMGRPTSKSLVQAVPGAPKQGGEPFPFG